MRGLGALAAIALTTGLCNGARAQTPATPMTPSEPHEKLAYFIGRWTIVEWPAEQAFVEVCDWLGGGRRHVICQSRWLSRSGPREGLSIFSYQPADGDYVYQGFRPSGGTQTLRGRPVDDGQGWEFLGEEGTGAERKRTRVSIAALDDGGFRFVERLATGDSEEWTEEIIHYARAEAPQLQQGN